MLGLLEGKLKFQLRFNGTLPEVRSGIESGHCPGAINTPFSIFINSEDGTMFPKEKLKEIFENNRVNLNKPLITMCGSGVTACIVYLALELVLEGNPKKSIRVYDGSWTEWASHSKSPIVSFQ